MQAEELLNAANARSIDLKAVAGSSSDTKGVARKRKLTASERKQRNEEKLGTDVVDTAQGRQSRSGKLFRNFLEDFGIAAAGVDGYREAALWWTCDVHRSSELRAYLHFGLLLELSTLARRYRWRDTVRERNGSYENYAERLCDLVLFEEVEPAKFKDNLERYCEMMRVTPHVWRMDLAFKYQHLRVAYHAWLEGARRPIQRRINGVPDDAEYAEAG